MLLTIYAFEEKWYNILLFLLTIPQTAENQDELYGHCKWHQILFLSNSRDECQVGTPLSNNKISCTDIAVNNEMNVDNCWQNRTTDTQYVISHLFF